MLLLDTKTQLLGQNFGFNTYHTPKKDRYRHREESLPSYDEVANSFNLHLPDALKPIVAPFLSTGSNVDLSTGTKVDLPNALQPADIVVPPGINQL